MNGRRKETIELLGIVVLLAIAGLTFMAAFVCVASEGNQGMTTEEIEQANTSERTCVLITMPVTAGAGAGAFVLGRRRERRRMQEYRRRAGRLP